MYIVDYFDSTVCEAEKYVGIAQKLGWQQQSVTSRDFPWGVRVAEWSKAPDSSSGPRMWAWVQIPLLTVRLFCHADN